MKLRTIVLCLGFCCVVLGIVYSIHDKEEDWYTVGGNKLISVSSQRVLYEHQNKKSFLVRIRIKNVAQKEIGRQTGGYRATRAEQSQTLLLRQRPHTSLRHPPARPASGR